MRNARRTFRRIVLPVMLLAPLLLLMVGCFYLPWFEHRTDTDRLPNVREVVGPADSQCHIRPGYVTRIQVQAVLGFPEYVSHDGTSEAYVARTSHGFWVAPICFVVEPADHKAYVVRMIYDEKDRLKSYEWAEDEEPVLFGGHPRPEDVAVAKLNQHGPKLFPAEDNGEANTQR